MVFPSFLWWPLIESRRPGCQRGRSTLESRPRRRSSWARRGRVQGHGEAGDLAVVVAADDVAVPIEPGKRGAVGERNPDLDAGSTPPPTAARRGPSDQPVAAFAGQRRGRRRAERVGLGKLRQQSASRRRIGQQSILFSTSNMRRACLCRRAARRGPARAAPPRRRRAARAVGMRDVAHMQDDVGRRHLLQRGAEGLHELGRQVGDEADRVRQDRVAARGQPRSRAWSGPASRTAGPRPCTPAPVSALNSVDLPALV